MERETIKGKKDPRQRHTLSAGDMVYIVTKRDHKNGRLTEGRIREILTSTSFHPHGIKVRLDNGEVGRVKEIF